MNIDDINERLTVAIEGWNVFGLPALLAILIIVTPRKPRAETDQERRKTVGRLGRIHLALAFWSLTTIVAELWAYRVMGIFPTNPITGLVGSTIMIVIDLSIDWACFVIRERLDGERFSGALFGR